MSRNDGSSERFFLSQEGSEESLPPMYSNFVGVHDGEDEVTLIFCVRRVNPINAGGQLLGIEPHTRIFLPHAAANKLYQALRGMYEHRD